MQTSYYIYEYIDVDEKVANVHNEVHNIKIDHFLQERTDKTCVQQANNCKRK